MTTTHHLPVRVYYEDTDAGGIVYYASYLRFLERGRTEWIRARGLSLHSLYETEGLLFVVRRVEADYLRPAVLDDVLEVVTELRALGGARIEMTQRVGRAGEVLFSAVVILVCVGRDGRPQRLTEDLRQRLSGG